MKQIAVVYYSGTGNTEALAKAVIEGVTEAGGKSKVIGCGLFRADMLDSFDGFAFGCPAMGSENLEDEIFEPMYESLLPHLKGKKVVLFGSYGWGDGEWMRQWRQSTEEAQALVVAEPVTALDIPDEQALQAARNLGRALVS